MYFICNKCLFQSFLQYSIPPLLQGPAQILPLIHTVSRHAQSPIPSPLLALPYLPATAKLLGKVVHLFKWSWSVFSTCHSIETTSALMKTFYLVFTHLPSHWHCRPLLPLETLCLTFASQSGHFLWVSLAHPWSSIHFIQPMNASPSGLLSRLSQDSLSNLAFPQAPHT